MNVGSNRSFHRFLSGFDKLCQQEMHPLEFKAIKELKKRAAASKNKVDFSGCSISDEQVVILCAALREHRSVAKVGLHHNAISDEAAGCLLELLAEQVSMVCSTPLDQRLHEVWLGALNMDHKNPGISDGTLSAMSFCGGILAYANVQAVIRETFRAKGGMDNKPILHGLFKDVYVAMLKGKEPSQSKCDDLIMDALGKPWPLRDYQDLENVIIHRLFTKKEVPINRQERTERISTFITDPKYQALVDSSFESPMRPAQAVQETEVSVEQVLAPFSGSDSGVGRRTSASALFGPIMEEEEEGVQEQEQEKQPLVVTDVEEEPERPPDAIAKKNTLRSMKERLSGGLPAPTVLSVNTSLSSTGSPMSAASPVSHRPSTDRNEKTPAPVSASKAVRRQSLSTERLFHSTGPGSAERNSSPNAPNDTSPRSANWRAPKSPTRRASTESPQRKFASIDLTGFTMNSLEMPPGIPEKSYVHIRRLVVTQCNLPTVDFDTLHNLPNLVEINLSHNNIRTISGSLPPTVLRLNLSHNQLEDVSCLAATKVSALRDLLLSNNHIKQLGLLPSKCLERLDLGDNMIADPLTLRMLGFCDQLASINLEGNPYCNTHKNWKLKLKSYLPRLIEVNGQLKKRPSKQKPYVPLADDFALDGTDVWRPSKAEQKVSDESMMKWKDDKQERWSQKRLEIEEELYIEVKAAPKMDSARIAAATRRLSVCRVMSPLTRRNDDGSSIVSGSTSKAAGWMHKSSSGSLDGGHGDWSADCKKLVDSAASAAALLYSAVIDRQTLDVHTANKFEARAKGLNLSDEAFLDQAVTVEELAQKESVAALSVVLRDSLWVLQTERANPEMAKSALQQIFETDAGVTVGAIIKKDDRAPSSKLSNEEVSANMEKVKRRLSTSLDLNFIYNDDLLSSFNSENETKAENVTWDGVVKNYLETEQDQAPSEIKDTATLIALAHTEPAPASSSTPFASIDANAFQEADVGPELSETLYVEKEPATASVSEPMAASEPAVVQHAAAPIPAPQSSPVTPNSKGDIRARLQAKIDAKKAAAEAAEAKA